VIESSDELWKASCSFTVFRWEYRKYGMGSVESKVTHDGVGDRWDAHACIAGRFFNNHRCG